MIAIVNALTGFVDYFSTVETELNNTQLSLEYNGSFIKPKWNGTEWIEGATPEEVIAINRLQVPLVVSQRQLRTQLVLNGFDLNDVQLAINQLNEPDKSIAQIAWDYAITFERESTLLQTLASMMSLSQQDVDTIFLNAAQL